MSKFKDLSVIKHIPLKQEIEVLIKHIPLKQEIEVMSGDPIPDEPFNHNMIIVTSEKRIVQKYSVRKLMTGWTIWSYY